MNDLKNDFEIQWQRRKQALKEAQNSVPSDEVLLNMAKTAQEQASVAEISPLPRRRLWIPYAAAACLLLGVLLYGLHFPKTEPNIPVAKEKIVKGGKIVFLCNSGCSAQDVIISANKIVNQ